MALASEPISQEVISLTSVTEASKEPETLPNSYSLLRPRTSDNVLTYLGTSRAGVDELFANMSGWVIQESLNNARRVNAVANWLADKFGIVGAKRSD